MPLLRQAAALLLDIVDLVHREGRAGTADVVHKCRGPIELDERVTRALEGQQLAFRTQHHAVDRRERSLRRAIEPADRFDDVADELETDGRRLRRREQIEHASTYAVLAM